MKKTIIFFVGKFFACFICTVLGISALLGRGLLFALKSHIIASLFIYPICTSFFNIFILIPAIVCIIAAKFKKVVLRNAFYIVLLFFFFLSGTFLFLFIGTPLIDIKKETPNIAEIDFDIHFSDKDDLSFEESDTIHVLWQSGSDFDDLNKLVLAKGQIVVKALKQFYVKNGLYPETLQDLIPDFLSKIPETDFYYGYACPHIGIFYTQTESGKNFELKVNKTREENFFWKEEQNYWVASMFWSLEKHYEVYGE